MLAAAINVVVDAVAIPHIGLLGAAIGTLLAFATRTLILTFISHRLVGVPSVGRLVVLAIPPATALAWAARTSAGL